MCAHAEDMLGARYRAFSLGKHAKLLSGRFTIWCLQNRHQRGDFVLSRFLLLALCFLTGPGGLETQNFSFMSCFAVISWARLRSYLQVFRSIRRNFSRNQ